MLIHTQTDKQYGLLLSGGIDSAVLLYLLIKENPRINLQPFTIPKQMVHICMLIQLLITLIVNLI